MKRSIALILLISILLVSVFGCGKIDSEDTTHKASESLSTSGPVSAPEIVNASEIQIIKDGIPNVTIVRGDEASDAEKSAMSSIANKIKQICGAAPDLKTDFSKDGIYDSSTYEILIGYTNYSESKSIYENLKYGEYKIEIVGNKIVIFTHVYSDLNFVIEKFTSFLYSTYDKTNKSLTFTKDDAMYGVTRQELITIPTITKKQPDAMEAGDKDTYQFVFSKADKSLFDDYLTKLDAANFTLHQRRTVSNNEFAIYVNEKNAVTVYYIPNGKTLRLIVEPIQNLFIEDKKSYEKITTPKLTMIGDEFTENSVKVGGLMCFILQLSDGRFIVVDGGVSTNGFANKIYNTMKTQSGKSSGIEIAAWIFTHTHSDHVGGFLRFTDLYRSSVSIERFIYHFPSLDTTKVMTAGGNDQQIKVESYIKQYYKNSTVNKCHTGQYFNISDATLEFYYTPDDYLLKGRKLSDTKYGNDMSIIFSVDLGGQRIMFLGDAQAINNNFAANTFGKYLKSDFVQIAHHGGLGGTNSIYNAVDPKVALMTTDDSRVYDYIETYKANYHLLYELNVVEWYNNDRRTYVFELPYTPKGSGWIDGLPAPIK